VRGIETYREPASDDRVRLCPYEPATARHLGQCEYVSETDPAVLKVLLKVKPGLGEGYDGCALRRERRVTRRRRQRTWEGVRDQGR
jgi:hypothetical protein